jgi:hypothetical protein
VLLSRHQNVGQNRDIKIANRSFENVSQFKYFWDDSNKSKFDSVGNQQENGFWQCLLPFGPEPSVFSSAIEKRKH